MPAVNDVGEPCAGEPHARFDGRGLETGRKHCRTAPAPDPTPNVTRHAVGEREKCLSHNEILVLSREQYARVEGTSQVKRTTGRSQEKSARRARRKARRGGSCRSWSAALAVSADGTGVVAHAGNVATRLLADQVGLTNALSGAMARRGFTPTHDLLTTGRVLADVAVLIAGGGEAIADIHVLRHQSEVLGSVASAPTVWRALKEITPATARRIDQARAKVRAHVWSQLPGGLPVSKVADTDLGDTVVLDVDATLVTTHSEKAGSASTFKKGFGYHPLGVWCDNSQESMALMLRPGNAGSNTVADHIAVLTAAIAQVPTQHRRKMLIRADGAGASHGLLDWLTALNAKRGRTVEYSPRGGTPRSGSRSPTRSATRSARSRRRRGRPRSTPRVRPGRTVTSSRSPACST